MLKKALKLLRTATLVPRKISYYDLRAFAKRVEAKPKTLIVYIEFEFEDIIKEYDILPQYQYQTDRYYELLEGIAPASYNTIICTGLLEHMSDPARLVKQCHSILAPGGKLYLSVSSVFAVHRGPEDYYHLTQYGTRHLFEQCAWQHLDIRGACGPFRTIGILLQRILLQAEVRFVFRPLIEALAWSITLLDGLVIRQYDGRTKTNEHLIDSMMPSNVQVIATK
ncbi:Methyltransferase domain-containing protein [Catalinimonas alkaloidigena]|uniref:Methyltransferase domain-containing protein n=1 Tax=Catalinimonas alkaloidigena TaxID=1075417 RepID=A0A1G9IQT9_9BACT|nr:methyltransferase domain-containing protein [Catalinimonas alkaloidigena]SDL27540.1 Methyltransferase domain-containing protein [Catalinimonas alkaloidigena]